MIAELRRYVVLGPYAGGNSLSRRAIGAWLWWRTWATTVAVVALAVLLEAALSTFA